jgi:hypothetical protein
MAPGTFTRLRVPAFQADALVALADMEDTSAAALAKALQQATPSVRLARFSQEVADLAGMDVAAASPIVDLLVQLYLLRTDDEHSLEDFVEEVAKASRDPELPVRPAPEREAALRKNLTLLLGLEESIALVARGADVRRSVERLHCASRILTEIRPVFGRSVREDPRAALLLHTLELSYHGDDGLRSLYVNLDRRGLLELRRTIDRALEKETTLKATLARASVPLFDDGGDDEP